jgi:hypothetical protein
MDLHRIADTYSFEERARRYRVFAEGCDDQLARWGYLQLAEYCAALAVRELRAASGGP